MNSYLAPLKEINFLLFDVFQTEKNWKNCSTLKDIIDKDTAMAILDEIAKIAENTISPLNQSGDTSGCSWKDGNVTTPAGYQKAFQQYAAGGWIGLAGDPQYGGMGMPYSLEMPINEIISSADLSFSLYPSLTSGACLALKYNASEKIKAMYLPKLYTGEFTGTMCLTESHSGSDLGNIKTKAVPQKNNTFLITGTKIFISGGEHDLTENIIHLVLAKLPDAPEGTRGITMFLVPKFKLTETGSTTNKLNGVSCSAIESKMGIKASATCVMNFDQAEGILIGEPNKGLQCMFTMMNTERLFVGMQGLGCAERSYQIAKAYAKDRLQGKATQTKQNSNNNDDPIIAHGDVRHMLLSMKAMIEAGRAFSIYLSNLLDKMHFSNNPEEKKTSDQLISLLTPVAKSFLSDNGFNSCVIGQQVLGGYGYIKEYSQEQLVRDVRITQIYEGTNGIQAMDLLGRKIIKDNGSAFNTLSNSIKEFITQNKTTPFTTSLSRALDRINLLTKNIIKSANSDSGVIGGSCTEYMQAIGYMIYAWMWVKITTTASEKIKTDNQDSSFYESKIITAHHFFDRLLPILYSSAEAAESDANNIFALKDEQF